MTSLFAIVPQNPAADPLAGSDDGDLSFIHSCIAQVGIARPPEAFLSLFIRPPPERLRLSFAHEIFNPIGKHFLVCFHHQLNAIIQAPNCSARGHCGKVTQ